MNLSLDLLILTRFFPYRIKFGTLIPNSLIMLVSLITPCYETKCNRRGARSEMPEHHEKHNRRDEWSFYEGECFLKSSKHLLCRLSNEQFLLNV